MTVIVLADTSGAMSAVRSHTLIYANLGDAYIHDDFQLEKKVSFINLPFPVGRSFVLKKKCENHSSGKAKSYLSKEEVKPEQLQCECFCQ